ncbi:SPOR domain-containing protein [Qipengyuania atrilutea]|uniref:SPOR domain-containing protein n=1 Tax=Qipengyuania atrilutea TaxID=2744473 RepID=A0A850H0G7_9SPHN|nr:SPOR domain-containing protein [Actirhodobacter atriluteus]NVD45391.1 SPOR domain-containing protein [Actirhodobacter atriluteus]
MTNNVKRTKMVTFAITTALASATLAGCSGSVAPEARVSAADAQDAMAKGKTSAAITHAEAAVLAEPQNVTHRVMLGAAYLEAGRFMSAETSFAEAMELGSRDPKVIVSRALAQTAVGRGEEALRLLKNHQDQIDPADLGLAYALAGEPGRGVLVLTDALRAGMDSAKIRQNLAYSYAMNGDWRDARLMAAQDVPADQLGDRMTEWAQHTLDGAHTLRVAALLGVEASADSGRPTALALHNNQSVEQLAMEVTGSATKELPPLPPSPKRDLPPAVNGAPASFKLDEEYAAAQLHEGLAQTPAAGGTDYDSDGFVDVPEFAAAEAAPPAVPFKPAKTSVSSDFLSDTDADEAEAGEIFDETYAVPNARIAGADASSTPEVGDSEQSVAKQGEHFAQLGSFFTEADAKRAWRIFQSRYPELENKQMVITKAKVRGKLYYRVSAADLAQDSASELCSVVKSKGGGCFAYGADNPLPGALDRVTRVARLS